MNTTYEADARSLKRQWEATTQAVGEARRLRGIAKRAESVADAEQWKTAEQAARMRERWAPISYKRIADSIGCNPRHVSEYIRIWKAYGASHAGLTFEECRSLLSPMMELIEPTISRHQFLEAFKLPEYRALAYGLLAQEEPEAVPTPTEIEPESSPSGSEFEAEAEDGEQSAAVGSEEIEPEEEAPEVAVPAAAAAIVQGAQVSENSNVGKRAINRARSMVRVVNKVEAETLARDVYEALRDGALAQLEQAEIRGVVKEIAAATETLHGVERELRWAHDHQQRETAVPDAIGTDVGS